MQTYQELRPISDWLPTTLKEVRKRGWEDLDVILFSGDAYVDHPSFGCAVIGRIIESEGLKVAIVPQPNWKDERDFMKLGKPRLFFGVTGGCMDPMVNHYTASKRRRSTDAYTPGGQAGFRPDYATSVYSQKLKELYPEVPVLIGGIEASLRRVTHYDYWQNKLMPSILKTSKADMLVYGMGEQPLREVITLLNRGVPFERIDTVKQTAVIKKNKIPKVRSWVDVQIGSHENCLENKLVYAKNFKTIEQESNKSYARRILQQIGEEILVINPPYPTMTEKQMDASFDLPYTRMPHPKYKKRGVIPAYEMIRHSVNMHRGCFGGCSFCTISAHQGKFIASRSQESILREVDEVTKMPDFKGYISDLGGPSANMYKLKGINESICDKCVSPSCIHPVICSNLDTSHQDMIDLLKKVDEHPEIKKAFIGSGIRYDLLTESYNKKGDNSMNDYLEQVVTRHISGRLKVAPEHTAEETLKIMRKPSFKHFKEFKRKYDRINKKHGLNQPLIPYFISSHPGTDASDMAELAAETKDLGFKLEQVQDFTPTPMTVATVIYYSGYHPYTLEKMETAIHSNEKKDQNIFFFWHKRENHFKIRQQLTKINRPDLERRLLGKKQEKEEMPSWLEERRKNKKKKKKR